MKRFIASILLLAIAISLCACDAKDTGDSVAETLGDEHTKNAIQTEETDIQNMDISNDLEMNIPIEPLEVVGFIVDDVSDTNYRDYYVLVKNCTEEVIHTISIGIVYLDENGNVVDTSYPQMGVRVQPGQTIFVDGLVEEGTATAMTIDKYSFYTMSEEYVSDYFTKEFEPISLSEDGEKIFVEMISISNNPVHDNCILSDAPDALTISNLSSEYTGYGFVNLYATITNNTDESIQNVKLKVICLDENGNIVNTTYPSLSARICPNQSAQIDGIVEADKYAYFTIDGYSYYTSDDEYVTGFLSVISKATPLDGSNIKHEGETKNETIPTEPTEPEPESISTEPEVVTTETQPMNSSNIAKETYDTMQSLTKDDCTINSLGQYVYNGLPLLDNSVNKNGSIQASAIYRKMALCLEAFELGNNWESYAPVILGYGPNSRSEFADLVDDLSTFIVNSQPANSIRKKLQSMESVEVAEEEKRYTISISNLAITAKEMGISDEMMGHILCAMYDGGASISFKDDGCIITYKDYWG